MAAIGRFTRLVLVRPFERFFRMEASGSLVLLAAAALALAWANSRFADAYFHLWEIHAGIHVGPYSLEKELLHWVNDGLMAVFFLLVGLEIKREFITGQLSNPRAAALPIVGALGGMIVPAALYVLLTRGTPDVAGWGIPMATDIAFALGAIAILGKRLPPSLRVFLAAAAIVDDLGAVLVIALFYTPHISGPALLAAAVVLAVLLGMNRAGVHRPFPYVLVGVLLWLAVLESGVHATIAGVLLALTIPASGRYAEPDLMDEAERALEELPERKAEVAVGQGEEVDRQVVLLAVEKAAEREGAPLVRIEHALVPWVAFGIMPLFAFANAGVALGGDLGAVARDPVVFGIILGLVVGKQIGFILFPWIAVRLRWAALPLGATWRHMYGVGWLAGIGFTMSLFIANLALAPERVEAAKIGILGASLIAGAGGLLILLAGGAKGEVRPRRSEG